MNRALLLFACSAVCGCQSSDAAPPDYSPTGGPSNVVTCDLLRDTSPPVDGAGHFVVDGGTAGCTPDGIECALGLCDGGAALAVCAFNAWQFQCAERPEAGKPEGGDHEAAGEDALDSADATPDASAD